MRIKKSGIIAIIGIIASLLVIAVLLSLNIRPYLTVSQVVENPSLYDNQEIQVIGIVDGFSDSNFSLKENTNSILIDTTFISIPEELKNGTQVVVKGIFHTSLILTANLILTQCS